MLHVFDGACNLVGDDGEVVSLVTAEIGPGPFSVVLASPYSFQAVDPKSPVSIDGTVVTIGSLIVETNTAQVWNPRPDWRSLQRTAVNFEPYLFPIQRVLSSRSVGSAVAAAVQTRLDSAAAMLLKGLDTGDRDACRRGAKLMAGAGMGSTPAGDDYLMGVIYALWMTRPLTEAGELASALVEMAVPLTTTLSAAWLRAAARGEAAQPWHDLVDAISAQDGLAVDRAIGRILSSGHTSGADALAGFTAVLARPQPLASRGFPKQTHSLT